MELAGVSNATLRLTGDTFHQFKSDYRKISQPERLGILSQLQLRIAAIYAVQNEELQRTKRQEDLQKRHSEIEAGRLQRQQQKRVQRQHAAQQARQAQQQVGTPVQGHMHPQQQQQHHMTQPNQHQQHMEQQQFQLPVPDSPGQQLMAMNLAMPQQPHQAQYPGPPKRMRGHRPSQGEQQAPQPQQ